MRPPALLRRRPTAPALVIGLLVLVAAGLIASGLRDGTSSSAGKAAQLGDLAVSLQPVAPYQRTTPNDAVAGKLPVPVLPDAADADAQFPPVQSQQPRVRVVDFTAPLSEAQAVAAGLAGVVAVAGYGVGEIPLGDEIRQVAAVDPATFRVFTPEVTANHPPLWARIAAGDVAINYELSQSDAFPLGETVPVGPAAEPVRVGAVASNGTPPVADAIVSLERGTALGLGERLALLVALTPETSPNLVAEELQAALGGSASVIEDPRNAIERIRLAGPITPTNVWDHLAACESGLDWHINTGNGYFGGLQFLPESWVLVGGAGLPHEASREEQIYRASLLWQRQGWEAWPTCARRLGLIVDPAPTSPAPLPTVPE